MIDDIIDLSRNELQLIALKQCNGDKQLFHASIAFEHADPWTVLPRQLILSLVDSGIFGYSFSALSKMGVPVKNVMKRDNCTVLVIDCIGLFGRPRASARDVLLSLLQSSSAVEAFMAAQPEVRITDTYERTAIARFGVVLTDAYLAAEISCDRVIPRLVMAAHLPSPPSPSLLVATSFVLEVSFPLAASCFVRARLHGTWLPVTLTTNGILLPSLPVETEGCLLIDFRYAEKPIYTQTQAILLTDDMLIAAEIRATRVDMLQESKMTSVIAALFAVGCALHRSATPQQLMMGAQAASEVGWPITSARCLVDLQGAMDVAEEVIEYFRCEAGIFDAEQLRMQCVSLLSQRVRTGSLSFTMAARAVIIIDAECDDVASDERKLLLLCEEQEIETAYSDPAS